MVLPLVGWFLSVAAIAQSGCSRQPGVVVDVRPTVPAIEARVAAPGSPSALEQLQKFWLDNWVIKQARRTGTNHALASSWLGWGTSLSQPRKGAITVIKKKVGTGDSATGSATGFHVAFLVSVNTAHARLLGGNQSDQVRYSNFSLAAYDVKGYRWPS